ncbi:MAG: hypothetical protein NZM44_03055, partial [Candidatus Calescibacterium sp.]|nr:hypothetical protein [Candidatus Calescibacterium sp.]
MVRKFFLFYVMFFSFFIFGFSEINGSYQDLLEYKIKGSKIYSTVYLDKIHLKLGSKVGKIGKEYFDYPTLYKYINSVQKQIGNTLLRNYVKMFLKNQIVIYTTFSVKDKSFKLPYYYAYILDSTMESTIHFDNSHNIRYMTSKLKNDYIDFYFSADNILLRGKLDFKVNFLKVGSITFDGFNGGVVFSSFPVFHMDLKLKVSRVFCKMDGFNVWINNTFLHNLDDKIFVRVYSICLRRNDIDFVGIENLSFHIKNFKYDNFIFLALSTKNEILRVRFLDRNIKFYKLFFDADFFYSKDELNFYFRVLDWKRDTFDFDFSFLRKYDGFLPNLGKKILEYLQLQDSKHYKTTRDLFLTVNLSTNSFNIFNKNFMIRFWGNKIEFFDRFLWINLDNLKIITLLYENEFGFIDLSNKKLTYISKISGFSIFWCNSLKFFI